MGDKMDPRQFTQEAMVRDRVKRLRNNYGDKVYSDIVDGQGNQYVDIVMQGGGVLGIALVGYTYVLEQAGLRFLRIGGTSAGAINALLLAALGTPEERKSERIIKHLANLDMYSFVDGSESAREFISTMVREAGQDSWLHRHFPVPYDVEKFTFVFHNIKSDLGLNPGDEFEQWLARVLKEAGISNTRDLEDRMNATPASLRKREGELLESSKHAYLGIVAADVTTETKAVFPQMAELYWDDRDNVNPAKYVRASMSIPLFFYPYKVKNIPQDKDGTTFQKWEDLADYGGNIPEECLFIDGGIMSNFPINLFHKTGRVPAAPTFGVQLSAARMKAHEVTDPLHLAGAVFDSARHCMDYDFIHQNPDYQNLIAVIDTENHHWLNFEMTGEEKIDLFVKGAEAAYQFLIDFDWEKYKVIRDHLAKACQEITETNIKAGAAKATT